MMAARHSIGKCTASQRGAVLIVCLVFMLILTIISVTSLQTSTLQERMAGNMKDTTIAFQAAEAALRNAENLLRTGVSGFSGSNGRYLSCPDPGDTRAACKIPDWQDYASNGWLSLDKKIPDSAKQPEFIIQQLNRSTSKVGPLDSDRVVSNDGFYRVIARGYGASDRSMVVLTTTFNRKE